MSDTGIVMFPPQVIALQAEIQQHEPLLIQLLQMPKDSPMEEKLGTVAAYVDIVLDGVYSEADIFALCDVLVARLKRKRGKLVLDVVSGIPH